MTAESLSPKRRWEDECELSAGRSQHRYRTRPPDLVTRPIAAGSASFLPLAGPAAPSDQPANDRHRGHGREFRRGWPGGPVIASVQRSGRCRWPSTWLSWLRTSRLAALETTASARLAIFECVTRTPEVAHCGRPSLPQRQEWSPSRAGTGGSRPGGVTHLRHRFQSCRWGPSESFKWDQDSVHRHLAVHGGLPGVEERSERRY
jgi:hypothetical protein